MKFLPVARSTDRTEALGVISRIGNTDRRKRTEVSVINFPEISPEDRAGAVIPLTYKQALAVPNRLDAWRRDNPNAFATWETKYGCVVVFWGWKIYYGRCVDCGGVVTTRRQADGRGQGSARWPKYCPECKERRCEEHNEQARYRMQRLRRERYKFRDAQFEENGLPPARQGVPTGKRAKRDQR